MSEDHLFIGSRIDSTGATHAGAVYQYSNPARQLVRKILNPHPQENDRFGSSIALNEEYVFIGASLDDDVGEDAGGVHVFHKTTGEFERSIYSPNAVVSGNFGNHLVVEGNDLFVAARGDLVDVDVKGGASVAAGRIYRYNLSTWELEQTFSNPDPDERDLFGQHFFIESNLLAVGAHLDDNAGTDSGQVYLFDIQTGELLRTIENPSPTAPGSRFGGGVALSPDFLAVGASLDSQQGDRAGAIFLFDRNNGTFLRTIFQPLPQPGAQFGGIHFFQDVLITAAAAPGIEYDRRGEVHIFDPETGEFLHTVTSPSSALRDHFGSAFASVGNNLAISAWGQNNSSGAVYFYQIDRGECVVPSPTITPTPTESPISTPTRTPTPQPGTATVAGYVVNSSDFSPIEGVVLSLDGAISQSNPEGLFFLHNIHPGTRELKAVYPGFEPYSLTMEWNQADAVLIEMNPRGTNPNADYNFDGYVDGNDLIEMRKNWHRHFPARNLRGGKEVLRAESLHDLIEAVDELKFSTPP
jgi:WD40 repeat protein